MSTLALRIANRRKELQMTQEELAKKLGYRTKSTISRIESGDNDIPLNKVDAFAAALETTRAYIMGWEEQPAAVPSSGVRAESKRFSKGFSDDKSLHLSKSNGLSNDKTLHQDESKEFYDTDRLLAEVRKYGTDTEKQRAALSAALDDLPIPERKRKLIQRILQMDPKQVELFLGMAEEMRSQ